MPAAVTEHRLCSPAEVLRLIDTAGVLGIDLETTGLDPRVDRIRLLSLADGNRTVVMDCFEHDIRTVMHALAGKILIAHNASFDLGFLWQAGLRDLPETICTMLLSRLLDGTRTPEGWHGLGQVVKRHLAIDLPKELQQSDWSGPLTGEQVAYAARDAHVLPRLFRKLRAEIDAAGLDRVAEVEMRALPAFVWLAQSGVPFDRGSWEGLARKAEATARELERRLSESAPPWGQPGLFGHADDWNWNSPQQVAEVFDLVGAPLGITDPKGGFHRTTNDAALAVSTHPLAEVLREHRHQAQMLKMYGNHWLEAATIHQGRVYPEWKQIGTDTGRTSCKQPNFQQIPRDEDPETRRVVYRTCVAASEGRRLVKADYATLQMRIACRYARDVALLNVFRDNADPHTATARHLLGRQDVTKADRQVAKSANFGLLFGMSAFGLRVYARTKFGVAFTDEEAKRHRAKFFELYHGLARWHAETRRNHAGESRSATGRRRVFHPATPDTERLNTPVQADEVDGLKRSLALLWERRHECPDTFPVLAVHDEIVLETSAERAEQAKAWLEEAMLDGMEPILDPVPCAVESKIVPTWGG